MWFNEFLIHLILRATKSNLDHSLGESEASNEAETSESEILRIAKQMFSSQNSPPIIINTCSPIFTNREDMLGELVRKKEDAKNQTEESVQNEFIYVDCCSYSHPINKTSYDLTDIESIAPLLDAKNSVKGVSFNGGSVL